MIIYLSTPTILGDPSGFYLAQGPEVALAGEGKLMVNDTIRPFPVQDRGRVDVDGLPTDDSPEGAIRLLVSSLEEVSSSKGLEDGLWVLAA